MLSVWYRLLGTAGALNVTDKQKTPPLVNVKIIRLLVAVPIIYYQPGEKATSGLFLAFPGRRLFFAFHAELDIL